MRNENTKHLEKSIQNWLIVFIVLLLLSGITAFPLRIELQWFANHINLFPKMFHTWILEVNYAIQYTSRNYPYLHYGTDWLAFAHIVIAIAFIGPLKHPLRNIWVIQFGMIACIMVFPLAFICGNIRGIPLFWQIIDCSFGVGGLFFLSIIYFKIKKLEKIYFLH